MEDPLNQKFGVALSRIQAKLNISDVMHTHTMEKFHY